jgi:hypothetical protein
MFTRKLNFRRALVFVTFITAFLSANNAFAFGSIGRNVDNICASAGNPLVVPGPLAQACTSCHNDGNGGSGAGKTAARGSNATILAYFCPAVTPPPPPPPPQPTCTDRDGDGYTVEEGCGVPVDCNDRNANVNPGALENCTDGVDNNCNDLVDTQDPAAINCPALCTDMDDDGYSIEGGECGPVDCNDNNAAVNPQAAEVCTDAVDNNCNGTIDAADPACTVVDDPMQALLDEIASLRSQLSQCQSGQPPVTDPPVVEPPVIDPPVVDTDDDDDDDAVVEDPRPSRWSWRRSRSRD